MLTRSQLRKHFPCKRCASSLTYACQIPLYNKGSSIPLPKLANCIELSKSLKLLVFFIVQELRAFGDRCESLAREFSDSEAFNRKCAIYTAFTIMDTFGRRLESMESEAQVRITACKTAFLRFIFCKIQWPCLQEAVFTPS